MSDKNEYWKEIFGDDLSEDLAEELGISGLTDGEEDEGTFPIDASFFEPDAQDAPGRDAAKRPGGAKGVGPDTDTNVIPPEVRDVAAYTSSNTPVGSSPEPTDGAGDLGEGLDGLDDLNDPVEGEEDEDDEEDERAVRVTRRKRTGCLGGLMYAAFILGAGIILACLAWMVADDILALTKEEIVAEITVPEGYELDDVTEELYDEGIIEYKFLFNWFCSVYDAEEKIQAGTYQVAAADYRAIINSMNQSSGELVEQTVTITEGKTLMETFEILEENEIATVEALTEAAAYGEFDYDFLAGLPTGDASRLEGYLFPDTYIFYKNQSAENVLIKMLSNFDTRMENNGVYELVEESELTLHEAITIAALIEKEYANADEATTISSVIHNRLNREMPLEIDAAIHYIIWPETREILTAADLQIDSPYNTHVYTGLPAGPIANPGMTAIKAALEPDSTDYLYYALNVDGVHEFFYSYEQQDAFVNSEQYYYYGQQ